MRTVATKTSTRRANGLGLKKDLKNVTPAIQKTVEKKTEIKEEVKALKMRKLQK